MIFGSEKNELGERVFVFRMTPDETVTFSEEKPVKILSGDSKGHFSITVKMTRPKTKEARFRGL